MLFIAISLQVLLSMILAFGLYDIPLKGSYLDTYALLVCQSLQGMSFGQFLSLCFDEEYSVMVCLTAIFEVILKKVSISRCFKYSEFL
jgi:flagellar biosynthesis protein FliR